MRVPLPVRSLPPLLALLLTVLPAAGQDPAPPLPPGVEDLPIGFGPGEEDLMHLIGANRNVTAPPVGPVRAAAEWDENIGVFCLWSNADLFDNLLQGGNEVYIITQNSSWWLSWLNSNGIPTGGVHFLNAPTNTFWVRDYGPWFLWDGNQVFGLLDNTYNRPRPLDDVIPSAIASTYRINFYEMDLTHTGGNHYTDGYGTSLSTRMVQSENPGKSEADVAQIFSDYLGVHRYLRPNIPYSIQHMDTFGKMLAPDTLLWGSFPEQSTPWVYCEAAGKELQTLQSPYGWPYKIHRMPLWNYSSSWTGYINSLQSGKKILVARYNTGNDATAQAIYQAAVPGYDVVMVASGGTDWGDSIHCRSRNFIRGDALRIYPRPHWEAADDDGLPYAVTAEVIPDNATSLSGNPVIFYSTTGGAPFSQVSMTPTGQPHEYAGSIPAQPAGTSISYYLHAEDLAGGSKDAPYVAPDGLFTIAVANDVSPPVLQHDALHGLTPAQWPPTLTCTAVDDTGIPDLLLEYAINGTAQPSLAMTKEDGSFRFSAAMTGSAGLGDLVTYRIVATDGASPANTIASPSAAWHSFVITARNHILVIERDKSPDSGAALMAACDDLGLDVQYTTSWPASLSDYDLLLICLGMSPTHQPLTSSQANALVAFLNAGGRAYLEGGNAWAQDSSKGIYRSYFGVSNATSGATLSGTLAGQAGQFTAGMSFAYAGEAGSSDHLTPAGGADTLLKVGSSVKAVAYSTGTYDAVAASFQSGGLTDATTPSHGKLYTALLLGRLGEPIGLVVHHAASDPLLVDMDLIGDAGASTLLFMALGPGWVPVGGKGVLQIDPATMMLVTPAILPAGGTLSLQGTVPADPALEGLELYFQAFTEGAGGAFRLTNRDRLTLHVP